MRTRFRESQEHPTLLTANKEYPVNFKLWGTSNYFKKGHRILIHNTTSNNTRFRRNHKSGKPLGHETEADISVANQTILHNASHLSAIVLPIVPAIGFTIRQL